MASVIQAQGSSFAWLVTSVTTSAFSSSITVGNTIVVFVVAGNASVDVSSVTDTAGNTYTRLYSMQDASGGGLDMEIWAAPITTGGSSVTVTASDSGSNLWYVAAYEVSGLTATPTVDQSTNTNHDASGGAVTTTFGSATTNASDLLIQANLCIGITGSNTYSLTSGWSNLLTGYDLTHASAKGFGAGVQVKPVSITGTFATAIGFSGTATSEFDGIMVAIKGVASSTFVAPKPYLITQAVKRSNFY
jgi:hypothetical protein